MQVMSTKTTPIERARRAVEHRLHLDALRHGQRPPRAQTFVDKRKQASKTWCRRKGDD
jgi:hypothetical protein